MKTEMQQFKVRTGQYGIPFLYAAELDRIGRIRRWVCVRALPDRA